MSDDNENEDSAWDGLAILLWPVLTYWKIRTWIHNRLHPNDPEEL